VPVLETAGPAYDPTSITGVLYHWPTGAHISVYVHRADEPPEADLARAVSDAIAAWNAVGLLGEVRLGITSDVRSADVIVHHAGAVPPVTTADCEPPLSFGSSYTHFCPDPADANSVLIFPLSDGTGGRVRMLVSVNRAAVDSEDIFRAHVAHEFGHVLGIGAHSSVTTDLMFGAPRRLTPSASDAQTLRYVLGQPSELRF
jgi:hypothetical protein